MRALPVTLVCTMLFLLQAPARGAHCTSHATSTTDLEKRTIVVDLSWAEDSFDYFFVDACQLDDCVYSYGFYAETNGLSGLQREDGRVDDTCHDLVEGDLFVF